MKDNFIHKSSEVSIDASIGDGHQIWQNCIVLKGAVLGENVKLAHNVFIESGVRIGNNVTIKDNVCLYSGVTIEDNVFIGPSAVFTNVVNPRSFISRKDEFQETLIKEGASVGAGAKIICGNIIGRYAFIGAGAVVTKDVLDHSIVTGNPAGFHGWISRSGYKLDEKLVCPDSSEKYIETKSGLVIEKEK